MIQYVDAINFLQSKCESVDAIFSQSGGVWSVELKLGITESCVGLSKQDCAQKVAIQAAKNLGWECK